MLFSVGFSRLLQIIALDFSSFLERGERGILTLQLLNSDKTSVSWRQPSDWNVQIKKNNGSESICWKALEVPQKLMHQSND